MAHHNYKKIKLLLIGPLPRKDKSPGGAARAFELLIFELRQDSRVQIDLVSSNLTRKNIFYRFTNMVLVFLASISKIPCCDVVALFTTTTSLKQTSKIIGFFAKCFNKPFLVRKFGGISHEELSTGPLTAQKALQITNILKNYVTLFLPETIYAYHVAINAGISTGWMANYRNLPNDKKVLVSKTCRRFVYMGHVRPGKGIRELIAATKYLKDSISVDVYGALMEGISESEFSASNNIFYRGVLSPDRVLETLRDYDAFVFPSRHEGEGHPGSLIEAFSMGLPAVTTNWKFIPEVADESCSILVPPGDPHAIADAMNLLASDSELYNRLSNGAHKRALLFDISVWSDVFIQICQNVAASKKIPDYLIYPESLKQHINLPH